MNGKMLIAASCLGLIACSICPGAALGQEETLDVRIGVLSPIQRPEIRFIEARELAFVEALSSNTPVVAAIFADPPATTQLAQGLIQDLQGIGVGENSQMAATLCAIEATEVPTRQQNLDQVYFHLEKVEGLLAEHVDVGRDISTTIRRTYASDPNAMYQSLHTSMETTRCVPDRVNALIDASEQARLAVVSQARQ